MLGIPTRYIHAHNGVLDLRDYRAAVELTVALARSLDQEAVEIRKIYSLSPSTNPEALPREGFDRDGYHYECSDILREVVMGSETQPLTQTETVESNNKEMETLLALLPQKKPVTTEDRGEREATG